MKFSMVLSGSGVRFYTYIGALRSLFQAGLYPSKIMGTSGGGLVAMFVAANYNPNRPLETIDRLETFIRSFRIKDLLDPGGLRWPRFWHGIYKGDKILVKLREVLPDNWDKMKLPVYVITSDRTANSAKIWGMQDGIEPALAARATMSLPIFDAVKIHDHWHTDGGTRAQYPLSFYNKYLNNKDPILGLRFKNLGEQGVLRPGQQGRAVQRFNNKLHFHFDNIDDLIESGTQLQMSMEHTAKNVILDVPVSSLDFDVSDDEVDTMIEMGERQAREWCIKNGWRG